CLSALSPGRELTDNTVYPPWNRQKRGGILLSQLPYNEILKNNMAQGIKILPICIASHFFVHIYYKKRPRPYIIIKDSQQNA
ncbi:MAG: hypothetical protein LUB83_02845, partial [Prevotellaceae bacterium]|nr:hypothetical protein [Prevotellaceae bacterium]